MLCTTAEARNEYLNNGTNTCAQGSFDVSIEQRDDQYNYNHIVLVIIMKELMMIDE